jgi:hypothetical protein
LLIERTGGHSGALTPGPAPSGGRASDTLRIEDLDAHIQKKPLGDLLAGLNSDDSVRGGDRASPESEGEEKEEESRRLKPDSHYHVPNLNSMRGPTLPILVRRSYSPSPSPSPA